MTQEKPISFLAGHAVGAVYSAALNPVCSLRFVWCPPGTGILGSCFDGAPTIERPCQPIRLTSGFWIAQTPITCTQWQEIFGQPSRLSERAPGCDELPAAGIAWDEARVFCSRLSERLRSDGSLDSAAAVDLPSEAQWEYACRAGTTESWFFGDDPVALKEFAWYRLNSEGRVHPVASRRPNPWGLFDLYGNVAEWCLDGFWRYEDAEVVDPLKLDEPGSMKVVRGGDYAAGADECRSAARAFSDRTNSYNETTGLRPVIRRISARG